MAISLTEQNQILKIVAGMFNAAPGGAILSDLAQAVESGTSMAQLADMLADTTQFKNDIMGGKVTAEQQAAVLMNNFGVTPDGVEGSPATLAEAFFVGQIDAGVGLGAIVLQAVQFLETTTNEAYAPYAALLNNKALVAGIHSQSYNISSVAEGQAVLAGVSSEGPSTIEEADAFLAELGGVETVFTLTQRADNLAGNSQDNVFKGPVTQNETGAGSLANTFETGDVLNGMGGRNILEADLIASGAIGGQNPAISAETSNIQEVYFRAQNVQGPLDNASNTTFVATIDAEKMQGVEQWWSDNSRADVRIEDIRSRPQDVTFGMRLTDPEVGYEAYFNPFFLEGDIDSQSFLTLVLQDITDGQAPSATELEKITVREINFDLNDVSFTLDSDDIRAANTWGELETAIAAELTATEGLENLSVTHLGNGVFEINDSTGGVFNVVQGEALILGVEADIDVRNRLVEGSPEDTEGQTSTTLLLDGVGQGSRGGAVNIAAMSGDRGVEVFNVLVDRDSEITSLSSVNSPNSVGRSFDLENQLEEVFLSHLGGGAGGKFEVGLRTVDSFGVSTTTDDRLQTNGLTDVRVFDATGFNAELKVGGSLTAAAFDKYLVGATEAVEFNYLLGDAGSNLTLAVDNMLAGDVDFALNILGGAADDRVNLVGLAVKQNTSVNGALGMNVLEVTTSTGFSATEDGFDIAAPAPTDLTAAQTSFGDVSNIDTVVIGPNTVNVGAQANAAAAIAAAAAANLADTTHDITAGGFGDVNNFVIATNTAIDYTVGGGTFTANGNGITDTRLINLDATEQTVEVSGKNQTLGTGNSDNDQAFGTIRLTDTMGAELDLLLQNTARATGNLNVATLTIDNTVPDGVSEVRTLNLESAGERQTTNTVGTLNGNLVNTFNLQGTQALTITNLASAANSVAALAENRDSLRVDGSELAGDLYLGVTGSVITDVDSALGTNRTVTLIGTEGESDILNIRDGVITTNATSISGFETVRFGDGGVGAAASPTITVATNFNATNVAGVQLYDLVDSNVAINLNNLRATENVQINALNTNGSTVAGDITLAAANPTTGSRVNVNFASNETGANLNAGFWAAGTANLNVQDYSIISLDMGGLAGESYNYDFNLNTLANPTSGNVNARTLEITGGQFDAGFMNIDSLTLNQLDTALTTVDFSGYAGNFFTDGWNSTTGSNAEVVVNQFGMQFDIGGDNTLFSVGVGVAANVVEIQGIDFTGNAGAFGDLAVGESITVTFAGGQYTFTNDTAAVIVNADISDAIFADAASAPSQFTITQTGGAGAEIEVNATSFGDMPEAVVTASDGANVPGGGNVIVADDVPTPGGLASGVPTSFVTVASEFLTRFIFTEDVFAQGVVWQIDNFQPFDAVGNVTLNTQTQLDLRQLGVDSSAKITIEAGDAFWASLTAAEQGNFSAPDAATINNAAQTVISSNDDLNFTIVLTGVDPANLGNENIVGVA